MTTREDFLGRVRDRLRAPVPTNHLRPIGPVRDEPIDYAVELSDPKGAFTSAATKVGAEIIAGADEELRSVLQRVVADVAPKRAVVSDDPECDGVAAILAELGVEVLEGGDPAVVATADLGVTGALAGVALTGSLLVDSGRARTRLASLLPETHLALLPADRIVPSPGSLLRDMAAWFPEGPPSNLVFITGPSRSADIELVITIGVHGPRRVLVALRSLRPTGR